MDKMLAELSESNRKLDKENTLLKEVVEFADTMLDGNTGMKKLADKLTEANKSIDTLKSNEKKLLGLIEVYKATFNATFETIKTIKESKGEELPTMKSMRDSFAEEENNSQFAIAGVDPETIVEVYGDGLAEGADCIRQALLYYMKLYNDEYESEEVDE